MNVFSNTKKFKKLIIVLVFLILFNFCFPQTVKAGDIVNNIVLGTARLFFSIFDGVLRIANRIFIGTADTTSSADLTEANTDENIYLTPENIIKGKFLLMDPNIFKDPSSGTYLDANGILRTINTKWKERA